MPAGRALRVGLSGWFCQRAGRPAGGGPRPAQAQRAVACGGREGRNAVAYTAAACYVRDCYCQAPSCCLVDQPLPIGWLPAAAGVWNPRFNYALLCPASLCAPLSALLCSVSVQVYLFAPRTATPASNLPCNTAPRSAAATRAARAGGGRAGGPLGQAAARGAGEESSVKAPRPGPRRRPRGATQRAPQLGRNPTHKRPKCHITHSRCAARDRRYACICRGRGNESARARRAARARARRARPRRRRAGAGAAERGRARAGGGLAGARAPATVGRRNGAVGRRGRGRRRLAAGRWPRFVLVMGVAAGFRERPPRARRAGGADRGRAPARRMKALPGARPLLAAAPPPRARAAARTAGAAGAAGLPRGRLGGRARGGGAQWHRRLACGCGPSGAGG